MVESGSLTQLRYLFVSVNLQTVRRLIFEITCQLFYLLFQIDDLLLGSLELLTEKVSLFRKLLLHRGLNIKCLLERFDEKLSYVLNVIHKHDITQLFLLFFVTAALIRQVMLFIALHAGDTSVSRATHLNDKFVESHEVLLNLFILLLVVILHQ